MNTNGTSGAGRLNYEMPVITVMPGHKEQSTFVDLQQTLSQLGFDDGSALLRLSFKNSGQPLEEAMTQISQYFKSSDPHASGAHTSTSAQHVSIPDPEKATPEATATVAGEIIRNGEPEPEQMDVDSGVDAQLSSGSGLPAVGGVPGSTAPKEPTENIPPSSPPAVLKTTSVPVQPAGANRNVRIFAAPTSATPQAAQNAFNEHDYEPTIEHAKSHQAALQARTRNQRLLSDKELADIENARQEKLKAAAEKGSSLRVRMPDQTIIQMAITKEDTAEVLYEFVEQFLQYKEPFQLKYVGPIGRQVLIPRDKKRLIEDLHFSTAELITFLWDDKASNEARLSRKTLAQEWQDKAQALKVEEPIAVEKPQTAAAPSKAEGKRKSTQSSADKESKLKNILGKGLFKR